MRGRSTQREWHEERRSHGLVRAKDLPRASQNTPTDRLPATLLELRQLQESDELLAKVGEDLGYFQKDGIMYRRWIPQGRGQDDAVEQVVLPKQYRRAVRELPNTIPLGDHLGKKKTAMKIRRRFYWQTLFCDVADICRSCDQCQKAGHQ